MKSKVEKVTGVDNLYLNRETKELFLGYISVCGTEPHEYRSFFGKCTDVGHPLETFREITVDEIKHRVLEFDARISDFPNFKNRTFKVEDGSLIVRDKVGSAVDHVHLMREEWVPFVQIPTGERTPEEIVLVAMINSIIVVHDQLNIDGTKDELIEEFECQCHSQSAEAKFHELVHSTVNDDGTINWGNVLYPEEKLVMRRCGHLPFEEMLDEILFEKDTPGGITIGDVVEGAVYLCRYDPCRLWESYENISVTSTDSTRYIDIW
jgi:hypothetical protein